MKSKSMKLLIACTLFVFTASNALATITLNSRSEEMTANATCDHAGSIELRFFDVDYTLITMHLDDEDYIRIRVTLSGTNTDFGTDQPVLCQAIRGTADVSSWNLPDFDYVAIDDFDPADDEEGEVSHFSGGADITAFVYGAKGSAYFDIYIVGMEDPTAFPDELSWLRVGLYQDLLDIGVAEVDTTPICADVHDFSGMARLTASYNFIPNTLTINSSDNRIGHLWNNNLHCAIWMKIPTALRLRTTKK